MVKTNTGTQPFAPGMDFSAATQFSADVEAQVHQTGHHRRGTVHNEQVVSGSADVGFLDGGQGATQSSYYVEGVDKTSDVSVLQMSVADLVAGFSPTMVPVEGHVQGEESRIMRDWLVRRIEIQTGLRVSMDVSDKFLFDLSTLGAAFLASGVGGIPTFEDPLGSEVYARLCQESVLLSCALPLSDEVNRFNPATATLTGETAFQMASARTTYSARRPQLDLIMGPYWERELPLYRGEIYYDSRSEKDSGVKVSIAVVTMARRFNSLLGRLSEIGNQRGDTELIIVLADPDNLSPEMLQRVKDKLDSLNYPAAVIGSRKNTIVTNRNLATAESKGQYILFIDDDVKMEGPVVRRLVGTLDEHSDIGIVSIPSYNPDGKIHKPKARYLKVPHGDETVLVDYFTGMIGAMRGDIARTVPFIPFWPNFAEDTMIGMQILKLGYFIAYTYPHDAHVIHEHVDWRATQSPQALRNMLVSEIMISFLEPRFHGTSRESRFLRFYAESIGLQTKSEPQLKLFWDEFRSRAHAYLEGDDHAFDYYYHVQNLRDVMPKQVVLEVILSLQQMRGDLVSFQRNVYARLNFSSIDPFTSGFTYGFVDQQGDTNDETLYSGVIQ